MRESLIHLAIYRPLMVYLLVALLAGVLGSQLPRIQIDTDPENMLPAGQAERVFHNRIKQEFALHDAIVVGAVNPEHPDGIYNPQSLAALHRLTAGILEIDGVIDRDVMSLSTVDNVGQGEAGSIRFEWMMREPPARDADALDIREKVQRLPLLTNTLVSEDGKAAVIYVPIEDKDESYRISREILAIIERLDTTDAYHLTGLPVAEDTFGYEMFVQMGISAPLAAAVIFLLMWYFFGNWRLVVAPMIVAMATVIMTMGLLIGLGFTVHIMSSMIPIFLMPIAVVDSIHVMSEFVDDYDGAEHQRDVIQRVMRHLFRPMLFTSITSAAGFLSLALTPIPPVQVFGVFVAVGIILAFVLTILFIPAWVVRMKPGALQGLLKRTREEGKVNTPLARALRGGGRFVVAHSVVVLVAVVAVTVVGVGGITRIEINDNPVRWFKSDHRIRVADRILNEHFAGTYDAHLVLGYNGADDPVLTLRASAREMESEAQAAGVDFAPVNVLLESPDQNLDGIINGLDDLSFEATDDLLPFVEGLLRQAEAVSSASRYFQNPEILAYMEDLQVALVGSGLAGKVNGLPDAVKTVMRDLGSGADTDYVLPESSAGVAQALLQYQSSHRPHDLWHMVNPGYDTSVLWVQLRSGDNQDMTRVINLVDRYIRGNPLPDGMSARWAGKTYVNVVWQDAMVRGMAKSLMGAFVVVLIMMIVLFRSFLFGLIAMLPLTVTIVLIYGLIGWIGKDYDMPIAVLSALTLGLSVDFAIHFIERARELYRRIGNFGEALGRTFEEPARAIARNAIVIALGFTPLVLAPLLPYVTVGIFLAGIMATSGLVTLLVLPAVLNLLRKFLFKPVMTAKTDGSAGR